MNALPASRSPAWPQPLDPVALADHWRDTWTTLGHAPPAGTYGCLDRAWREPQRHYHDIRHLGECLALLQRWQAEAERPAEVALALWFHDAVYDAQAHDNEARSAEWAAQSLKGAGEAVARRVADLVLATRHDVPADGRDAALLIDIDLAILGSPTERFAAYDRDVRLEYAHVPEADYRQRRAAVLQAFLDRPRLYRCAPAAAVLEAQARTNLGAAIGGLA